MKFIVKRTSRGFDTDIQPCEEAFQGKDDKWYIKIESLEELLKFVERHKEVVIYPDWIFGSKLFIIEIYDTYRE